MAKLSLSLLGSFQAFLGEELITNFKSNKVRALLAYLAVEADKLHRRESLAGLLWPDWPNRDALSNLRYTLSDLRNAIGDRASDPPFLTISRESLQFNLISNFQVDVRDFVEFERIINYIIYNPVKAGLVQNWQEWPGTYCRTD